MQVGEVVRVLATDPSTCRDIPRFCQFLGHELLGRDEKDGLYTFWVRKQQKQCEDNGFSE
jgi:tRNA 2-thiouridine synthesizing protein A